jgi:hypothetical protein
VGTTEDGKLFRRESVDKDNKNPTCMARYPFYKEKKEGGALEKTTTACFKKHLDDKHEGWLDMLTEEDRLATGGSSGTRTILSCFPAGDGHRKKRQKVQVSRTVICIGYLLLLFLNLYPSAAGLNQEDPENVYKG